MVAEISDVGAAASCERERKGRRCGLGKRIRWWLRQRYVRNRRRREERIVGEVRMVENRGLAVADSE